MIDFLRMNWEWLTALVSGGGLLRLLQWYSSNKEQEHSFAKELRQEFLEHMQRVEDHAEALDKRVAELEEELAEERKLRRREERINNRLQIKFDQILAELNRMRAEQGMEPLQPKLITLDEDLDTPQSAD